MKTPKQTPEEFLHLLEIMHSTPPNVFESESREKIRQWIEKEERIKLDLIRARDAEWQANDALREAAQEALDELRYLAVGCDPASRTTEATVKLAAALASAPARTVPKDVSI